MRYANAPSGGGTGPHSPNGLTAQLSSSAALFAAPTEYFDTAMRHSVPNLRPEAELIFLGARRYPDASAQERMWQLLEIDLDWTTYRPKPFTTMSARCSISTCTILSRAAPRQ
jgi:hypothetical protein